MIINAYEKLGNTLSGELQLLAEEKWILEALGQIKDERNRLQIESLHLESMKAKYHLTDILSSITTDCQSNVSSQTNHNIDIDDIEELCNNDEELNLMVADHPRLVKTIIEDHSGEEEEEEEDDDDEMEDIDVDDILLDINMLMFGHKTD